MGGGSFSKGGSYYNGNLGAGATVPDQLSYNAQTVTTGASEPDWVTGNLNTTSDPGGFTWTAIYARVTDGASVTGVISGTMFQHNKTVYPDHYFQYGSITFTSGRNTGFSCAVRDSYGQVTIGGVTSAPYMQLLEVPPNLMLPGDDFTATVGCNKSRGACQNFNNFRRYRGFPDMPTEDRALSTPNQSSHGYAQNPNRK